MSKLTKNQLKFLNALVDHRGLISRAADQCSLHRTLHYKWLASSDVYKQEYDAINEASVDMVENALLELIDNGDTAATIFFLKTKGKQRGYIERSEITGADGGPVQTTQVILEFTDKVDPKRGDVG